MGNTLNSKKNRMLIQEIYANRRLVWDLAKNDFKTRYSGSFLGMAWGFIQPVITVLVYWFVFTVAMGFDKIEGVPYALWLVSGLVPWFFFSDGLTGGTTSMLEYSYLVKKVVFNIDILPVVKVMAAVFTHIFFIIFTIIMFTVSGRPLNVHYLQIIYYSFCTFMFSLSLSYITSSVVVFFRDLTQIVNIILQIGVWITPILWTMDRIHGSLVWFFYLNPVYYLVSGYRDSLILNVSIISRWRMGLYFWAVTLVLMLVGRKLFGRLKVHFADVL